MQNLNSMITNYDTVLNRKTIIISQNITTLINKYVIECGFEKLEQLKMQLL